jgi:phosphoglycerol transferase
MINQKKSGKFLRSEQVKRTGIFGTLAWTGLVALAGLCFFAARWYIRTYGDLGFDSIMYTVFSDLGGVQSGLLISFGLKAAVPAVLLAAAAFLMLRQLRKTRVQRVLVRLTALCMSLLMILQAAFSTGLPEYVYGLFHETPVFDQYYVQPTAENVKFPEEKRNLIYIFLESMEISYLSEELGGGQEDNLIPELYELATEHTNFSHDDTQVGGFLPVSGATWTIGAMVAHTAGVPLKLPPDVAENDYGQGDDGFLPGITSLQNILHDQGYYQTLMVGSVASFGGRRQYYLQHGADYVYDISTARRDDIVEDDYFVWWGMEDKYLFEYAREELTEIAKKDQPFAFTMLTVDTHHIGGYFCEYCENEHEEQYENVMSCSSKQVMEFVEWLEQQPFYENTTIIITGDHLSMDKGYFNRNVDEDYVRRNYNCFINSAVDTVFDENRQFSALDMFPTTLAALGCTIEGEYLGLGVNLFSGKPTLIEKLGYEKFDRQLTMSSDYYAEKFRLEMPEETENN